jgi:hypothetical protein
MAVILNPDMLLTKDRPGRSRVFLGRLPTPYQPQTPQYYAALCILDWLQSVDPEVPGWVSQIDNARQSLELAWSEESGNHPATEGYLRAEMARTECLAGNLDDADRLLNLARDNFSSAGFDKEVTQIDDILASLAPLPY